MNLNVQPSVIFRTLILMISLSIPSIVDGQNLFKGENGTLKFFSGSLLEDIEAETNKTASALNLATGEIAVLIPIKSFVFDKSLMREHFNENYLESDKYPEATFKGNTTSKLMLKTGDINPVNVSGILNIHGVAKHRDIQITLTASADGSIMARGKFNIKVADHDITIPSIVFQNIAEVVEVTFEFILNPAGTP